MEISLNNSRITTVGFPVKIAPKCIITLQQARREKITPNTVTTLKKSISELGQFHSGIIAAMTRPEAEEYLCLINELWGTGYDISQFSPTYITEKKGFYYLYLISGHRRLCACIELGIEYCAEIFFKKRPLQLVREQIEENFHKAIPLQDEMKNAVLLWRLCKARDQKLTLKKFSGEYLSHGPSWLSNAIRFANLPESVQQYYIEGKLSMTILHELAKVFDYAKKKNYEMATDELVRMCQVMIVERMTYTQIVEQLKPLYQEIDGQIKLEFQLYPDHNNNTKQLLTTIKRQSTIYQQNAKEYLKSTKPIVTRLGREYANGVIRDADEIIPPINKILHDIN